MAQIFANGNLILCGHSVLIVKWLDSLGVLRPFSALVYLADVISLNELWFAELTNHQQHNSHWFGDTTHPFNCVCNLLIDGNIITFGHFTLTVFHKSPAYLKCILFNKHEIFPGSIPSEGTQNLEAAGEE